jgi:APA family basic amino acid/polyamine antiporter
VAQNAPSVEVRFSRELTVARAVARSLAILLAVFIFALHGLVMAAAGPASSLSFLLAGLVISLSLLCYVELLHRSAREGGAYLLLRESTRGPMAFLTGWAILLGGPLLCAVLALGFSATLSAVVEAEWSVSLPQGPVAAALIALVAAYNVVGGWGQRRARDTVTWLVVGTLLVIGLLSLARLRLENLRPFLLHGHQGVQAALSMLLIGFLALESVALTVSEVRRPRQAIPWTLFSAVVVASLLGAGVSLVAAGAVGPESLGQSVLPLAAMALESLGRYGQLLMLLLSLVFIPLALNSALLLAVRQAHEMEQDGLLPDLLRRRAPRYETPFVVLGMVGFAAMLFALTQDPALLARMGSVTALFIMSMVALGDALRLRGAEEEESSGLRLPVPPLFPALALVVNVFLVPTVGVKPLPPVVLWLAAGMLFYLVYARARYIKGQEGVVVFRGKRQPVEAKYRVLVPLGSAEHRSQSIQLAVALAGEGGQVIPLRVVTLPAQVPLREGSRMAEGVGSVFTWSVGGEETGSVSLAPVTRVARSVSQGILDTATEEKCDLILLNWEAHGAAKGRIRGQVLDPVVENATCDVVLVKDGAPAEVHSILLPTSGGPHATIAARLAVKLARKYGAQLTALYVSREGATAEDRQHGQEMIARTIEGLGADDLVVPKVIRAPGVVGGILNEAKGYDLVMLGASEEGLFDRVLFGTIPERIARKSSAPVLIAKERAPMPQFWLRHLWTTVYRIFPTLEAEERSTVYRQIRDGARADIDFFVMITLSATIATLGLLLNSGAVIIGGMLVAPLLSPIIGISLAIALGNVRLLRDAAESTVKGIFLAGVVALFLSSVLPLGELSDQILARTAPNLLDLLIALASGAAGAYAMSRKEMSAALPGVAIAAALVPPLGVVGVGLAARQFAVAGGGLLLFGTNLVGITLAGTVNFLLLGFRPVGGAKEREGRMRRGLVVSILLLLVVSLPLGFVSGRTVQASQEEQVVRRVVTEQLSQVQGASLVDLQLELHGQKLSLVVTIYATEGTEKGLAEQLDAALTKEVGQEVSLRLIAIPVTETTYP